MPEGKLQVEVDVQVAPEFAGEVCAERLQAVACAVLQFEAWTGSEPAELALVLTDDDGIQALNRDFLDIDAPTDVLAFGTQEEDDGPFVAAPEAGGYLGDVIISYPRAVSQAQEHGHSTEQELDLLVVHGMLHLMGYDHADEEERAAMWARQDAILSNLSTLPD
ncbi:MAG: rRNA maturation RNase YbeY [Anaerolineae bacterium]|jgi:probable rRNA maturation factor